MPTISITKDTFNQVTAKGVVLIDWWAPWCAPCRAFAPIYEKTAAAHPDVVFAKVDTEDQPELGAAFRIRAIPTLMVLRDGILLFEQAGMLPPAAIDDLIRQAQALDMDDVRRAAKSKKPAA